MSVSEALRAPHELWAEARDRLARVLTSPYGWPHDSALAALATEFLRGRGGAIQPPAPRIGEACLLSVKQIGAAHHGAMWALDPAPVRGGATFVNDARVTALRAHEIARQLCPLLCVPSRLAAAPASEARFLYSPEHAAPDRTLDGASFAAAMCLAEVSRLLGRPARGDVVATARVTAGGELLPVDGLAAKLEAVALGALGVRRVLIAREDTDAKTTAVLAEARRVVARCQRADLEVDAVGTLAEVFEIAFDLARALGEGELVEPSRRPALIDELFALALGGSSNLLGWRGVAATAERLAAAALLAGETERAWRGRITCGIALRHEGEPSLLEWPSAEALDGHSRRQRLELVAHLVQSASDAEPSRVPEYVERARSTLREPRDRSGEDFKLLGAIGRALAANGQLDEAELELRAAIDGWFHEHSAREAGMPLCELVRIVGVRRRSSDLAALLHGEVATLLADPALPAISRAYLQLAAGRALVQSGSAQVAIRDRLAGACEVAWESAPASVRLPRLRWLARAYDALGQRAFAADARRSLEAAAPTPQRSLAQLDEALAQGADVEPAMRALLLLDGAEEPPVALEARNTLRRLHPGRALAALARDPVAAQALADQYRY